MTPRKFFHIRTRHKHIDPGMNIEYHAGEEKMVKATNESCSCATVDKLMGKKKALNSGIG